ncbi:hypothetical protein IQ268_16780 [Oculatella sp. LEGE 06141]|uniref:TrbI/VirB10 family protein n=1 Tax=Oculatella sp. LEGE 06141 TaxID=1828648 RepID=UPI001882BF9F|nr:TrbI/VirB10 family protein [Oculatella sp. LEGE 06141]MBE9180220.1 hypothetical protein [Oculatella sp. LEGE 06141]
MNNTSENNTSDFEWDEASFDKLVGLEPDEQTVSPSATKKAAPKESQVVEPTPKEPQAVEPTAATVNPILSDKELFDDPHQNATPKKLSGSPWAKVTMVGAGLFVIFGTAGLMVSRIMTEGGKVDLQTFDPGAPSPSPSPSPSSSPVDKDGKTVGELKGELALSQQKDGFQAAEEAANGQRADEVSPTDLDAQQRRNAQSQPPQSTVAVARIPPPVPPAPARTVARTPPPVRQAAAPPSRTASSGSPGGGSARAAQPRPVSPAEELNNSIEQWEVLAQVGSYETTAIPVSETTVASIPTAARIQTPRSFSRDALLVRDDSPETLLAQSIAEVSPSDPTLAQIEEAKLQAQQTRSQLPPGDMVPTVSTTVETSPTVTDVEPSIQAQAPLAELESRVLEGIPTTTTQQLPTGTNAIGTLSSPLMWADNANLDSRFVVTLDEPLLDSSGQVAVPVETSLVFELNAVSGNGLVSASAVSIVSNGSELALPERAITLQGLDGPLFAEQDSDDGGIDLSSALVGAIANVGAVITQPDTQVSQTFNGGFSSSSSSTRGNRNVLGAVLEGAATPVLEQITERNQQALRTVGPQESVWYLPAGESVQVFVNQSLEF